MKKYNLILPIAGEANRFKEAGYLMPKPMIPCRDRTILEYAMDPFNMEEANVIFIVQKNHVDNYSLDYFLRNKFGQDIKIVELKSLTKGALCTCLHSEPYVDKQLPTVIYTPDVTFHPNFKIENFGIYEAALLTFKANSEDHSYARLDEDGFVVETKEKEIISDRAAVGLYFFRDYNKFHKYATLMIENSEMTKGEYYICPLYNYYIKDNFKVGSILTEKLYVLGTPKELEFYERFVLVDTFRIGLCSDHSGYEAKEYVKEFLINSEIDFVDYGCFSLKDCDYNIYVEQASKRLLDNHVDIVFGFCRTGQGVNICANKIEDILSCIVYDDYSCEYAVRHNCCNFFTFPSKDLTKEKFHKYLNIIKENKFDGGRHYTRISKFKKYK